MSCKVTKENIIDKIKGDLESKFPNISFIEKDGALKATTNGNLNFFANQLNANYQSDRYGIIASVEDNNIYITPSQELADAMTEQNKQDDLKKQEEINTTNKNAVNYLLKAVDILSSDKAKQVFAKGEKVGWDLNKILTELQIPKEQKQIILDKNINNREEIITSLLAENSFVVEISTAKEELENYDMVDVTGESDFQPREFIPDTDYVEEYDENGNIIGMKEVLSEKGKKQIEERENRRKPTQHYSNLTVPGGTNYTENEITTPAIAPSIKGHAQFATSNGIGWFRSDESQQYQETDIQSIIDNLQKSGQLEINCK